jgi:hypothetical protein
MMKITQSEVEELEQIYPGIASSIKSFEDAEVPVCPLCGSADTADVQVGVIGRTICLVSATTKVKLIPNGPKPGRYFCNTCGNFFNLDSEKEE